MSDSDYQSWIVDLEMEFQDIQIRASENWSYMQALRECFLVMMPSLQPALVPYLDQSVKSTLGEAFPLINEVGHQTILRRLAAQKEEFARSAIDTATVAIIQATLDFRHQSVSGPACKSRPDNLGK